MKVANPPLFSQLHAASMINVAAEKKPPCLIVCVDPSTKMLAIATVTEVGLEHWSISGPTAPDDVEIIIDKFRTDMGLESESVHVFKFHPSQIVKHSAAKGQQN